MYKIGDLIWIEELNSFGLRERTIRGTIIRFEDCIYEACNKCSGVARENKVLVIKNDDGGVLQRRCPDYVSCYRSYRVLSTPFRINKISEV